MKGGYKMSIRDLRELLEMSQAEFGERYGIPMRTIQSWEEGIRKCPEYVPALLERCVKLDWEAEHRGQRYVIIIIGERDRNIIAMADELEQVKYMFDNNMFHKESDDAHIVRLVDYYLGNYEYLE